MPVKEEDAEGVPTFKFMKKVGFVPNRELPEEIKEKENKVYKWVPHLGNSYNIDKLCI